MKTDSQAAQAETCSFRYHRAQPVLGHDDAVLIIGKGNVQTPHVTRSRIAKKVRDLAIARTPFSTGFRLHKQLRALVQAHALYCGRSIVKKEDFEEIRKPKATQRAN